mgnify:CR=1 FL=1|tara:strand:+ start:36 stop:311 length:276 start_codon:yes stop_codon:yes gene_type:complete
MDFNVNQCIRSAVVLVVGLPVSVGVALSVVPKGETQALKTVNSLKGELTTTCLEYALSKSDSKMERAAKDSIDEKFGAGANYGEVCRWVLS